MKPLCIVQARMNSPRLPGKVMMEVKGKPLLGYLLERLQYFDVVVAVPAKDKKLLKYLKSGEFYSVGWFPWDGPEDDVAGRFAAVLDVYKPDTFIRICADSPLLDPALVDAAVALYEPPYIIIRSPVGCVEVCDTAEFLATIPYMKDYEREHVTCGMRDLSGAQYNIRLKDKRLVVDTAEDFERVKSVIEKMDRPHTEYGWRECLALL